MHIHRPCLVLVPDTSISVLDTGLVAGGKRPASTSVLVQCIQEEFEYVPVEPVLRKYWSDSAGISALRGVSSLVSGTNLRSYPGLEFINQLCVEDNERAATLVAVSNK